MKVVLLTMNDYADHEHITRMSVYRRIKAGTIQAIRDPKDKHWYVMTEIEDGDEVFMDEEKVEKAMETVKAAKEDFN